MARTNRTGMEDSLITCKPTEPNFFCKMRRKQKEKLRTSRRDPNIIKSAFFSVAALMIAFPIAGVNGNETIQEKGTFLFDLTTLVDQNLIRHSFVLLIQLQLQFSHHSHVIGRITSSEAARIFREYMERIS